MMNRDFLEKVIPNYNGNTRVLAETLDGLELTLVYETPDLQDDQFKDFATGFEFRRDELKNFKNCSDYTTHIKTKNHLAGNHYSYIHSGKNHKSDSHNLDKLIK